MRYFHKGRHRKQARVGRKVAAVALSVAMAGFTFGTAEASPPGGWGPIVSCESNSNPTAQNRSSTASGLFQFINGTWAAYGGREFAPTAKQATIEEQYVIAERAYAREGTRPWNASKDCWSRRTNEQAPSGTYTVVRNDTLSGIARDHDTTWQELVATNQLRDPNLIVIGDQIKIPA